MLIFNTGVVCIIFWILSYVYSVNSLLKITNTCVNTITIPVKNNYFDIDFVTSLLAISQVKYPTIADSVVFREEDYLQVSIIINYCSCVYKKYRLHNNYVLFYNGTTYLNNMSSENLQRASQVVGFSIVSDEKHYISFTILDMNNNFTYPIKTRILYPPKKKQHLGVCAYFSNYNTISEMISWFSYYQMVGANKLLLYYSENVTSLISKISKLNLNGFIRVYNFSWPLNNKYKFIQRSIQAAQMNSCFYRHRYEYEYILTIDVDEYLLSYKHPFDLYISIRELEVNKYNVYKVIRLSLCNM